MSWNPFKKAFSTRRMRSEDLEFEREVNKLKQIQAVSKRMYKDMKRCNEMEAGFLRCEQHLVNGVKTSPLARAEPLKSMAEVLGDIIQLLHIHSRDLKTNQDTVFVDPIKRLNDVYKLVLLHTKQREQKLQEYERQQVKLEKQGRKAISASQSQQQQSGSQSRLELSQRAVTAARMDYERVHERLIQEIPQLLEGRVDYFDSCLLAVMKAQSLYYGESSGSILIGLKNLREICDINENDRGAVKSDERIEETTRSQLTAIRTLSIVGNQSL